MCSKCDDWHSAYKDRGAYRIEDEYDYDGHPKRRKRKRHKLPRPRPGCPENDGKAHVYVIIEIHGWVHEKFYDHNTPWVPAVRWETRCVGCGKVKRYWGKWDGSPLGRYFNKEDIFQVEYISKGESFRHWW